MPVGRRIWANSEQMSFAVEALASSPELRAVDGRGLRLLSKREMDVVRSLAEGLTNREIAERLGLSQHTIKNYLFRVYDKLGVSNRLELLFMTLTQAGAPQSMAAPPISGISGKGYEAKSGAVAKGVPSQRTTRHPEHPVRIPVSYQLRRGRISTSPGKTKGLVRQDPAQRLH